MVPSGTIITERCLLTPLQAADRAVVSLLYRNEQVRKFLGGVVSAEDFARRFPVMLDEASGPKWAIRLKETDEFVGLISLTPHHDGIDQEISFQLLPAYWRTGYAREVINAILHHAETVLDLSAVVAETRVDNTRARDLLESVGLELQQTLTRFGQRQVVYRKCLGL